MSAGGGSSAEALRVSLLSLLVRSVYLGVVYVLTPEFSIVGRFTDSSSYLELAEAFQAGEWRDLSLAARRFWPGFPLAIALVSGLMHIPTLPAAVLVSVFASSASSYLVARVHGTRVAILFTFLPPDWLFYGSLVYSEALATSLVWLSIFLISRTLRYDLAIGVAALAALVRPQGAFLLVALVIQGFRDRRMRGVVLGGIVAALLAALWFLYLFLKTGEPFSTLTGYSDIGQWKGFPVTLPFASIVHELVTSRVVWIRKIYLVVLWGVTVSAAIGGFRRFMSAADRENGSGIGSGGEAGGVSAGSVLGVESLFLSIFIAYFAIENSPWGFTAFSRFVIPVSPVILAAFEQHLPRRKWGYLVAWSASVALAVAIFLRTPTGAA